MSGPGGDSAVTVCIASYNTRHATELAIRRVLAQRDVDLRVWVGDSGSRDGSPEMLADFARRGLIEFEHAPGGRSHGEWLDLWTRTVPTGYAAFVDSDLFLLRRTALRDMLRVLQRDAAIATCTFVPEITDYVSPVNGDRYRLAARVAPWLVALRVQTVKALDVSWCYRWEDRPDLPERAMSYAVGADIYAAVTAAGERVAVMPASFARAYVHVGGLAWIDSATGRQDVVRRAKRGLVTAGLQMARLRRLA